MANVKQQLETPSIPSLGFPPEVYERRHFNENNGALNIFHKKVISVFAALFGLRGAKFINTPHGAFHDSTDQVASNTTSANIVTLDTADLQNGVTLSNGSRLNVVDAGIYNVQFSIQLKNTDNAAHDVDVWFRKNGSNIADSNSRLHLPVRKSAGDPSHIIAALNLFVELTENDYVELCWRPENTAVSIEHYGSSTTPTRPAVPSVIVTVAFVSNLPT